MHAEKEKLSGPVLEDRIGAFLTAGDVWVQGMNRKAGRAILPDFSMWPTLAATAVLGVVIAWYGWCSCKALGDVVRLNQEKALQNLSVQEPPVNGYSAQGSVQKWHRALSCVPQPR